MPPKESEQSAFNFAVEYLKQINTSLIMCKQMAAAQNIDGWMTWIRAAYRELAAKLNEKEEEPFDKSFKEIVELMNDREKRVKELGSILYKLDRLEIKVRQKLQKKGMLLPGRDDPRWAIARM